MALAVPPGRGPAPEIDLETRPTSAVRNVLPRRPALQLPKLSVVIINFCQWQNTAQLTRQLRQSEAIRTGDAEIIIVDNHSPTHPVKRRLQRMYGVQLSESNLNRGFATAANHGARLGNGEWILLLNPDVTVGEGFVDSAIQLAETYARQHPDAGVIGFQLRNRDSTPQASAGPFPTLATTLRGLWHPRSRRRCHHHTLKQSTPVDWVTGGCLLVRRECFEQLHGMDEAFFLYYEDVDFCLRARSLGYSVWYDPTLVVTHHWPLHARTVPAPLRLITRHALLTYALKHWSGWQTALLGRIIRLEARVRQLISRWRGNAADAKTYAELACLVNDLFYQRTASESARIRSAAQLLCAVASAQDARQS